MVQVPAAGLVRNTHSTVSMVFAAPPLFDVLSWPAPERPTLPQYDVPPGDVTRSVRSLTRSIAAAGLPAGSR
jgi:hypothetical protein